MKRFFKVVISLRNGIYSGDPAITQQEQTIEVDVPDKLLHLQTSLQDDFGKTVCITLEMNASIHPEKELKDT